MDDVDDLFFSRIDNPITPTTTITKEISVMPISQLREAIANILQKTKSMKLFQKEIDKVQAYFKVLDAAWFIQYIYH